MINMKKITIGIFSLIASIGLFSCIKNDPVLFQDSVVEFDVAVYNTNNAYTLPPDSIAFPILVRVPAVGRQVSNATDSLLRRNTGSVSLRVNLVGAHRKQPTTISYRILNKNEYKLIGVVSNTNDQAVAGTHYTALPGTVTIPADSSFGFININILNPGVSSTTPRELVLMLTESGDVKPSRNYKVAGIRISQQ